MRRKYFIRIPGSPTQWITTSCIKAMEFTHSFGTVGFHLFSKVEKTEEIDFIMPI